jgi:uncharacterized membrane protein YeaQ/YmgE (transglycosylase-associated protein family)
MGWLTWIVWGLFVGVFARLLIPGKQKIGVIWTVVIGVAGSVLGGYFATHVIDIADSDTFDFGSFLIAVGTSAAILTVVGAYDSRFGSGRQERLEAKRKGKLGQG